MTDATIPSTRNPPTSIMRLVGYTLIALGVVAAMLNGPINEDLFGIFIGSGLISFGIMLVIAGAIEQRLIEINHTLRTKG